MLAEWPYRRFIKAFGSFQRRLICDELRQRRIAHIAALHANTNYDGTDANRGKAISEIELAYEQLIADAWNGTSAKDREKASGQAFDSPFMRAGLRAAGSLEPPMLPGEAQIAALPG